MSNIKTKKQIEELVAKQESAKKEMELVKSLIKSEKQRLNVLRLQLEMEKLKHLEKKMKNENELN